MSKFTFVQEQTYNSTKNTFEFEAVQLDEVLEQFQYFLKGCGYNLDGSHLEVVDDDQCTSTTELEEKDLDIYTERLFAKK